MDDNIDLALRHTKAPPDDAVAKRLVTLSRVVCATPAYLATHGTPEHPGELAWHTCFGYLQAEASSTLELIGRNGEQVSVPISSRFRFNNLDCVLDAVLAGHGLAILPTYLVCVVGNMIPVPFIYLFARKFLIWGYHKPIIGPICKFCIVKGEKGGRALEAKAGRGLVVALLLFVGMFWMWQHAALEAALKANAANAAAEHLIRHIKGIHRNTHNCTGQGHHSIMVNFFLQSGIHKILLCKQNILNMFFMYIL